MPSPSPASTLTARFQVELGPGDMTRLSALFPDLDPADAVVAAIRALAAGPDIGAEVTAIGQQQQTVLTGLQQLSQIIDRVGAQVIAAGAEAGRQRNAELLQGFADLLLDGDGEVDESTPAGG